MSKKLSIDEFAEQLFDALCTQYDGDAEIRLVPMSKQGQDLHGIMIRESKNSNAGKDIAPIFYAEDLMTAYNHGRSISDLANDVLMSYKTQISRMSKILAMTEDLLDYKKAKSRLGVSLINKTCNKNYLRGLAYTTIFDIAETYVLTLPDEYNGMEIKVTNDILDKWDIDINELQAAARTNMPKITEYNMYKSDSVPGMPPLPEFTGYDFSDKFRTVYCLVAENGASAPGLIMCKSFLKSFAGLFPTDLYVLPLLPDLTIIFPVVKDADIAQLKSLAMHAFNSYGPEARITQNVYRYSYEQDRLQII